MPNPKDKTPNPKDKTPNPKDKTPNPKDKTPNQEDKTQNQEDNIKPNLSVLYSTFGAADEIVLNKHIQKLSLCKCAELPEQLKKIQIGDNVSLFKVERIVYDIEENIQDKLTTVYSSVLSMNNGSAVMILKGKVNEVELYLGVATKNFKLINNNEIKVEEKELEKYDRTLRNTFLGNFPGTTFELVNNITLSDKDTNKIISVGKDHVIEDIMKNADYVAAVSSIPALRNNKQHKNQEFVQGLEKLIDSMRGREYSMIIISDVVDNDTIESLCASYEDIYSQLSPFKQSIETVGESDGATNTESFINGVTNTTNESIAKTITHGTATSKTHTDTVGGSVGSGFKISNIGFSASMNYSHSYSRTKTEMENEGETTTNGTAQSLTEQNSVAKALSNTKHKSIQLTTENRAVRTLMERIDEQIKRLRSCEDFGLFNTCAYFLSSDYETTVSAASVFKSITRGENSSVESSALNIWQDEENVENIKNYISRFYHPEFEYFEYVIEKDEDEKNKLNSTPATYVSGKEIAFQMTFPKKSVAGVPVLKCAEFGREIFGEDIGISDILLGNIYHMHNVEENKVKLNSDSFTSHAFITGSTGSGKSNTVYKILDEVSKLKTTDNRKVKFMVIEPAKGEYKNVFGMNKDISVYGTNPKLSELLRINPFAFPEEIHIYEHIDRLVEIFNACWPMYAAMPAVLKDAIISAYEKCGWDLINSENNNGMFPTFSDVTKCVEENINISSYSSDTKGDYIGSLVTRLHSLSNGINGMIFTSEEIDSSKLFDENVIIDLSRVGSLETKSLIMGILVMKLNEYRMSESDGMNSSLKHITVLEEAHNLLKRTSTEQSQESSNLAGKSVQMISNSIAEMRTYGEGFIIVDQSPTAVDISAIKNTNTKIILRLPEENDRKVVGKAAALNDEQINEVAKLSRGVAVVYQNNWIEPVLCKVDKFDNEENKFEYSPDFNSIEVDDKRLRTDLINFLLGRGENLDLDLSQLKIDIQSSNYSSIDKLEYISMINEYEMSKDISVWSIQNFGKLSKIISNLILKGKNVISCVLKNNELDELNRSLNELINSSLIVDRINDNIRFDIMQCLMKSYSLEAQDIELYAIWRENVVRRGGLS